MGRIARRSLGREARLLIGLLAVPSSVKETGECCFSGIAVESVGCLLELDPVEKALNVISQSSARARLWPRSVGWVRHASTRPAARRHH